jgi:hypothetical protein
MPHYHLFQTDLEGEFLAGTSILLEDDEAAIAKAREICHNCNVEVWKGQVKLAVIRNEDSPPGNISEQQRAPSP